MGLSRQAMHSASRDIRIPQAVTLLARMKFRLMALVSITAIVAMVSVIMGARAASWLLFISVPLQRYLAIFALVQEPKRQIRAGDIDQAIDWRAQAIPVKPVHGD